VENRDAYDSSDKVKVRQMFLIKRKTNSTHNKAMYEQLKIEIKQYRNHKTMELRYLEQCLKRD